MKKSKVLPDNEITEDKKTESLDELDITNFEKSVDFSKSKKRAYLSTIS